MTYSRKDYILWSIYFSVGLEVVTIACRLLYGGTGAEFAEKHDVPLWLRIHHFWWGLLPIAVSFMFIRRPRWHFWLLTFGIGVFVSDWLHHLVYSPIVYGDMSWHWP